MTGEHYLRVFARLYNINAVSLRYFNVFGPHQDPTSEYAAVIPKFIRLILRGERPVIYGDGAQSRDFTYIDNVVSANLLACKNLKGSRGLVANIACGKRYTLRDLVKYINEILGTDIKPVFSDPAPGDVKHSLADISAAKKFLKYRPLVDMKEGLKRTTAWMKEHHDNAR
jgi:UDP-glucose 4-epimerase